MLCAFFKRKSRDELIWSSISDAHRRTASQITALIANLANEIAGMPGCATVGGVASVEQNRNVLSGWGRRGRHSRPRVLPGPRLIESLPRVWCAQKACGGPLTCGKGVGVAAERNCHP